MNAHVTHLETAAQNTAISAPVGVTHPASSIDTVSGWYLQNYCGTALMTMQVYSTPRVAMKRTPEVGRWIEVSPTLWRSEDGRWVLSCT